MPYYEKMKTSAPKDLYDGDFYTNISTILKECGVRTSKVKDDKNAFFIRGTPSQRLCVLEELVSRHQCPDEYGTIKYKGNTYRLWWD